MKFCPAQIVPLFTVIVGLGFTFTVAVLLEPTQPAAVVTETE